jgi:hypothetical protein
MAEIDGSGRIDQATGGQDLVVLEVPPERERPDENLMREIHRILKATGKLIYTQAYGTGSLLQAGPAGFPETSEEVAASLRSFGFSVRAKLNFASLAVRYLDRDVLECQKPNDRLLVE